MHIARNQIIVSLAVSPSTEIFDFRKFENVTLYNASIVYLSVFAVSQSDILTAPAGAKGGNDTIPHQE